MTRSYSRLDCLGIEEFSLIICNKIWLLWYNPQLSVACCNGTKPAQKYV